MKTACIFTFHNVPNYGAVLQTYALSHYVKQKLGYHVDIMDYQCVGNGCEFAPEEYIKKLVSSRKKLLSIYKKIMVSRNFKRDYEEKFYKFQQFKKNQLSEVPYNKKYEYDAVILGSDQIWNPEITGGFQPEFFGQSDLVRSTVKVAYAASCGDISKQTESQKAEMIKYVKVLDYIGVREKSLSDFLDAQGFKNTCTLDPTFLLSSDEYNDLIPDGSNKEKPYLLVYELQKSEDLERIAFKIANENGLAVKILTGYASYIKKKSYEINNAGPIEFLSLIKNADYVLTNSFHGTAFSLIYRKSFNVVLPKTRTSRIVDLLKVIGLENRIADGKTLNFEPINYDLTADTLQELTEHSKRYLQKALGGAQIE